MPVSNAIFQQTNSHIGFLLGQMSSTLYIWITVMVAILDLSSLKLIYTWIPLPVET